MFKLESKTEVSVTKAQNYTYTGRGRHHTGKHSPGGGDTAHTFLMGVTNGVGKKIYCEGGHHTYFVEWGNNGGSDSAQQ